MSAVAEAYLETYDRLTTLARELTDAELAAPVPACPGWSVRDTLAHLTGVAVDLVAGEGSVASPDSTARHISDRADDPVEAVLDEWAAVVDRLAELLAAAGSGLTAAAIDVWTHEQDMRNAIGRPGGRDAPGLGLTLKAAIAADQRIQQAGLAPMHLVTGDKTWFLGAGAHEGAGVRLELDPYEAARMLMGRRTYREMAAYPWEGDPAPYLPLLHQFTAPERSLEE